MASNAPVNVPVAAGNLPPPVGAESAGNNVNNSHPPTNSPGKAKKILTLTGTVLAESGAGFGVGAMLAKGNVTGTSLLVAAASLIFAFDVALRYTPSTLGRGVFVPAVVATLLLSMVALIPYTIMKTKGKGKAPAAAVPTMASLWTVGALGFTAFQARGGGQVQGALQGSILSIMYMALASIAGYNAQTKQAGTGTFAGALWAMLAMFDALGLSRT